MNTFKNYKNNLKIFIGCHQLVFDRNKLLRTCVWNPLATNQTSLLCNHRKLHISPKNRKIYQSSHGNVDIPLQSIPEYLGDIHLKFKNKTALVEAINGRSVTFEQLRDSIYKVTSGLARHGVKKGDMVMIISENNINFIIMTHAVLSLGGSITTCNPNYLVPDLIKQASQSKTSFIASSHFYSGKARQIQKQLPNIKKIFSFEKDRGMVPMDELLNDDGTLYPSNLDIDVKNHIAILPYSSGTTGLPKGVMLTHLNEVANSIQISHHDSKELENIGNLTQMALLPFYHIFGIIISLVYSIKLGFPSIILPSFDPKLFLETIQKYKVSVINIVPPIILFLNKHPMVSHFDISSLKYLTSGAAPLPKQVVGDFYEKYPHSNLRIGYGLTETSPVVTLNHYNLGLKFAGSCGLPMPNTLIKFVDEKGKPVKDGENGELLVKGPQVMKGYYDNPEATSNAFDSEGFFKTGDIGHIDKEGQVYVVERLKELIKYKGFQVPPAELEAVLCSHPSIADAAVIGVPDDEAGELPKAFVAFKPETSESLENIHHFINERVVPFKRLRGGIEVVPQIPRSPAGKILRKDLKSNTP